MMQHSKTTSKSRSAFRPRALMMGVSVSALSLSVPLLAADTELTEIDEIVIYGEKRETTVQDAEIAISALQGDLLERANILDVTGLNGYVPGLLVTNSGGSEKMVSIRGVGMGTPENFFAQPGVSFHIDGAYIPNSIALNMGFFDLERVEVLRGPQGTVFGQSSTGGTINVITKKPDLNAFGGEAEVTVGNYGFLQTYGAVNVPISDTLAIRGSFQTQKHDGYAEATSVEGFDSYDLDDADNQHFRAALLWEPSDELSITLSGTTYSDDHNGAALKNIDDPEPDPRILTQDHPATFEMDMDFLYLGVEYELPFATLKSVTSYQDLSHDQSFDADRLDVATFGGYDHVATWSTATETVMQEFTLTSPSDQDFRWILGFFYTDLQSEQYVNEFAESGVTEIGDTTVLPKDLDPADIPGNLNYSSLADVDRKSWASFFQASYDVSDRFSLTFGARYNKDKYDGTGLDFFGLFGPGATREFNADVWTGKVAASYDVSDDSMVYASVARGYKPGGINPAANNSQSVSFQYEPEVVETIEIGSKNMFANKRVMFNATAFYSFYDNMHFIQEDPVPFSGGIANIPKSEIWGLEFEAAVKLMDKRLTLSANASIIDGEVKSEFLALDRRLADMAGDAALASGAAPFPWSAEWFAARSAAATQVLGNEPPNLSNSYRISAEWAEPVENFGMVIGLAEFIKTGSYQARIFNTEGADGTPGYEQLNFSLLIEPDDMPWKLSLKLINVTDEAGVNGRFVDPYSSGQVSNQYIPPRQFLATLGFRF